MRESGRPGEALKPQASSSTPSADAVCSTELRWRWATARPASRSLNGRSYFGGHYATIVGYRAGGTEFAVSDPAYSGGGLHWLSASNVSSGIKLRRYVA
ncbi:hypothetical protein [Lentzea sp. NPDC055074]